MSAAGILSFGAYIPQRRLQRSAIHAANAWFAPNLRGLSKGEKAIANWDEDALTMAVEAARDCLIGVDRAGVAGLSLASTTLPFADRLNAGVVKEALTLADAVAALDTTGSQRVATSALMLALNGTYPHLCIAAERRKARPASEAEMQQGDGAAAVLVGTGDVVARYIGGHSVTIDFVDHFRQSGADFDYAWEGRWVRDEGYAAILGKALVDGLAKLNVDPARVDRVIIPIPVKGVPESLAKAAGINTDAVADTLSATVGDTGAAHPLLMLAHALETAEPGQIIVLTAFGQGADILVFETTDAIATHPARVGVTGCLASGRADTNYQRFLFHRGLINLERGMRAEFDQKQPGTTLYRNRKAALGLIGGRCTKTGTVQFPKTDISVNPNDRASGTQEDYPLADKRVTVRTFTADALTYSPDPPNWYGMLDFEGGGRIIAEFADVTADDVTVDAQMRMAFRIKGQDDQRDFTKYFWKAVPLRRGE